MRCILLDRLDAGRQRRISFRCEQGYFRISTRVGDASAGGNLHRLGRVILGKPEVDWLEVSLSWNPTGEGRGWFSMVNDGARDGMRIFLSASTTTFLSASLAGLTVDSQILSTHARTSGSIPGWLTNAEKKVSHANRTGKGSGNPTSSSAACTGGSLTISQGSSGAT